MELVEGWNELVARCAEHGLEDGCYTVPAGLRWSRPRGSQRIVLGDVPAAYAAFVDAIGGHPVFGLEYYDREGWSFLPPSAQQALSVNLPDPDDAWPKPDAQGVTRCTFVFFAGMELSDIEGWSFGPDPETGELAVWETRGMPYEPLGTFETWFAGRLQAALQRVSDASEDQLQAWRECLAEETDPHRLIDYSIERRLADIPRRTAADLALHWVVDQRETPYRFGLWDDGAAAWRIEPRPFYGVSPFTEGVAEVILAEAGSSYGGPWVRIDPDGNRVA